MEVPDTDDYVMLSALQHYVFCPRQCALIHVEQTFDENIYTLRGQRVHERVNIPEGESFEGIRVERSLTLWSHQHRLTGIADLVEFSFDHTPYPVEYKSGSRKPRRADDVQLCAQALCLEEMFGIAVPKGAIFHHASKRRREVIFDPDLRSLVIETAHQVRQMLTQSIVPPPVADQRCPDCSLLDACMPHAIQDFRKLAQSNNPFFVPLDP
ncbi:CRISPR-associated exonuclease, Cas4 family [Thalassoporum mexicanum PCC 7367]|uniref:CRISPR-associated protein Cas4 n=1 Tax=Thalassoporum mexicanum TaxID=3457544 RepID=UPI00029FF621|nr:CRISPR-associated protein Cas4 [Pseudanabaena sp. PCC 7367]AFY70026.1 CRISPR-associated exonuclease, Cas4 family [Pseudanabaena sp. PCC 7367]